MPGKIEGTLKTNEVATLRGTARFLGPTAIEVDGTRLQARHFLIATGAKPRPLDVPGAEHVIAADQSMELEDLPPRILFVGGGYISFEFAHIAARAGAVVRIIDRGEQPLKGFDPDLVEKLVDRTRKVGIEIHLGAPLVSIVKSGGFLVTAGTEGGLQEWNVDLVVHGAGRVPALDRLDLTAAGVDANEKGVAVNEFLQSVSGCVSKVVEIGFGASPSGLSFAAVRPRGQGFRRRLADRGFPIHRLCASGFGRKRGAPRGASALFRDTAARSVF